MIPALALAAALAAAPAAPGRDALRARYGGIRSLSADVRQLKEGRYWARPFESRIRFRYTPERIVWETVAPVHATVVIEGDRIVTTGSDGITRPLGTLSGDPRVAALLRFIRALVSLDLDAIERDFSIRWGERELVATPREGSQPRLFERIRFGFDAQHELASVELETASERTRLEFRDVRREGPAEAPSSPAAP